MNRAGESDVGHKENLMYLTSRVDNLRREILALVADDFAEGVLNGRVVALDEVSVDELYCQTRFACSASS